MNRKFSGENLNNGSFDRDFKNIPAENALEKSVSGDIFKAVQEILVQGGIEPGEARAEANLVVAEFSGLRIEEVLAGKAISDDIKAKILDTVQKRVQTGAPIQHLLGFAYFMGDKFFVDENVLIPRPETELLVQCAAKKVREIATEQGMQYTVNILDVGTGTGCIPIEISKALKDVPIEAMGVDISVDALRVAIKNMEALGEQRRVIFRKSDIFKGLREIDKFDIIVSNPPYIPVSARECLQNEVKNFDPDLALFAPDKDGVEFYRRILEDAKKHLKACTIKDTAKQGINIESAAAQSNVQNTTVKQCTPRGYVLFELGFTNEVSQAEIVSKIALEKGYKIEFIEKDLSGINRVICLSC